MIVLHKKRLIIIMILLCVVMTVASIKRTFIKNSCVETTVIPVTNRVIILDAGHGKPDEGAESSNGVTEEKINLAIVLKLQNLLEQSGAKVILTRSDENGIYSVDSKTLREKKISDLKNRVFIGNKSGADLFISIHLNKISDSKYHGWQTFYNSNDKNSIKIAKCIQNSLNETMQEKNTRIPMKLDKIYLMKHVDIPISIVECGFLSNKEEEKNLLEDTYQNKLAWGIFGGISDYFADQENNISKK